MFEKYESSRSKYSITKAPFREICEVVVGIDNQHLIIKLPRVFIRLLVRSAGYKVSARILGGLLLLKKRNTDSRWLKYLFYLLEVNKMRIEYFDLLYDNQFISAVLKKNKWAEFSLTESMNYGSRLSARRYLSLLSRHGYGVQNYEKCEIAPKGATDKKFYIYGPNAMVAPSTKYQDHILVLMKPIGTDISCFKQKILFSNSAYYGNVISGNKDMKIKLLEEFQTIYVNCRKAKISPPFVRSKFPIGDQLASPMALGRVLYNLLIRYGKFSCVIEGFDFYLDKNMYADYYPTPAEQPNGIISEQVMCSSLAEHDALYNFLFVKELMAYLKILDSHAFKEVIKVSGMDYLNRLAKVRDFRSLR